MAMECENKQCKGLPGHRLYPMPVVLGGEYGRQVVKVFLCPVCLEELYSTRPVLSYRHVWGMAYSKAQPRQPFFTRRALPAAG